MISFSERIRSLLFWFIDDLKGRKTRSYIRQINLIFNNYTSKNAQAILDNQMESILKHATETTAFYSDYKGYKSVTYFPVINKNIIRERYNDFLSNDFTNKDLVTVETSGSTGTPFKTFQDRNKRSKHLADTIYFNDCVGLTLGMTVYYIRDWGEGHKKSKIKAFIQNIVQISVFDLRDEVISSFIKKIKNEKSQVVLMGYPSSFETICRFLEASSLKVPEEKVKSVICIAEALEPNTCALIKRCFSAPVISRYANNENGIIAQQLKKGDVEFYINSSSFYIEVLDFNKDIPVPDGTPGRIVLTDFFNYAMPMIRYDTGDIGILDYKNINDSIYRVLTSIEGRKFDMIFSTSGKYVFPQILLAFMTKCNDIKQYQIIQSGRLNYQLVLNCEDPYHDIAGLKDQLLKYLGEDALIEIKYVNEIPLLSSGKRRIIVNNYSQTIG